MEAGSDPCDCCPGNLRDGKYYRAAAGGGGFTFLLSLAPNRFEQEQE